jgi:hypothetical protein
MIDKILSGIQTYIMTTPPVELASDVFQYTFWIPIFGVIVWGITEVWVDARQGKYAAAMKFQLLQVSVPQDAIQTPKGMENFFTTLAGSKSSITWKEKWLHGKFQAYFSFEIVSMGGDIKFYIRTVGKYRDVIEAALYAQYPEAQILEVDDYVDALPDDYPNDDWDIWGTEMVTRKEAHMPLRTYPMFEHQGEKDQRFKDPLLTLLEMLGKMREGEMYWLQFIIMQPDEQDWRKGGEKLIKKLLGKEDPPKSGGWISDTIGWIPEEAANQLFDYQPLEAERKKGDDFAAFKLTPLEKELVDAVNFKIGKFGWWSKIRFVYGAKHELYRKGTIASMTKGFFHQFGHLNWNKIGIFGATTPKDDYFWQEWQMEKKKRSLVSRFKGRSFSGGSTPFILNTEELATLFHFPAADARTPALASLGARRSEPPADLRFAGAESPDLPNIDRTTADAPSVQPVSIRSVAPQPLSTPSLSSPTGSRIPVSAKVNELTSPVQAPLPGSVLTPQPVAPTAPVAPVVVSTPPVLPAEENIPRPGMPAPLPPGLDLADEPIESNGSPTNLPL